MNKKTINQYQCLKCLTPVKTIAKLLLSQYSILKLSLIDPPGWIIELEDLVNQKVFYQLDWVVRQNMQKILFIQKI